MNTGLVGFEERMQIEMDNLCEKAEVKLDAFDYRLLSQERKKKSHLWAI